MIRCLISGGTDAEKLQKYILKKSGGSIEVDNDHVYSSLYKDKHLVERAYIKANYLIILLDEIKDIRAEIKTLADLLKDATFFRIETIKIYGINTAENEKGVTQLRQVIKDVNIQKNTNYVVDVTLRDSMIPFSVIYSDITEIVKEDDQKIPIKKVYRVERGTSATEGYEPEQVGKIMCVPNIPDGAKKYSKIKKAAIKGETNNPIFAEKQTDLEKTDLQLNNLEIDKPLYTHNIIIVAGYPKAGTSTFATTLSRSLVVVSGKKINLVDLSDNCGSTRSITNKTSKVKPVDNRSLLLGDDPRDTKLKLFSSAGLSDKVKHEYFRFLLSIPNRIPSDYTIVDCNIKDLQQIIACCPKQILRVILVSQAIENEVYLMKPEVEWSLGKGYNTTIYLNNSINYDSSFAPVDSTDVKLMYKDVTVISPLRDIFKKYDFSKILLDKEVDKNE